MEAAVSLAGDPQRLLHMRASLRPRLRASPLMDHAGYAHNLAAAYRAMWRRWRRPSATPPAP